MKNIEEILTSVGITVPEDKKGDFEAAFNENYKTVSEAEKLRTARDNYKSQLETAQNALKEFEGVDVKDLQGKIDKLNNDLAQKDSDYFIRQRLLEWIPCLATNHAFKGRNNFKSRI